MCYNIGGIVMGSSIVITMPPTIWGVYPVLWGALPPYPLP